MKRPCHGAKKRWRDVLKVDLQAIGVHDRWYELCQDRKGWFHLYLDGVEKISTSRQWNTCSANEQSELRTLSYACGRKFSKTRRSDQTPTFLCDAIISKVYCHWSWIHSGHCHHGTQYHGQLSSKCV